MSTHPSAAPALDHGLIGNGTVLALVSPTAAVEWLCMPRFDSPSVFARLLDAERGGGFRLLWDGEEVRGAQRYLPNTNVLETRFSRDGAAWEVIDFAPRLPRGWEVFAPPRVVRVVRPLRGVVRLRVDFDPRLDYARRDARHAARQRHRGPPRGRRRHAAHERPARVCDRRPRVRAP